LRMSVGRVTTVLQILFLVGPPIAWYLTRRACIALRDRPGPDRTERAAPVARTSGGGYLGHDDPQNAHTPTDDPAESVEVIS
jgi:hypothetical protein